MKIARYVLCFILILWWVSTGSLAAVVNSPYQLVENPYDQIHEEVYDTLGTSLQEIADGYTPQSRIGWKIAINGIDESTDSSTMEFGYGYITGYDTTTSVLKGQGRMFRMSPGGTQSPPDVTDLGNASLDIYVDENKLNIFTSGSDPEHHTAWAQSLGTYTNLQDGGDRIFYGLGNNPDYSASMCILTLKSRSISLESSEEDNLIGSKDLQYKTPSPTPTASLDTGKMRQVSTFKVE